MQSKTYHSLNFQNLDSQQQYKLLSAMVTPRPIAWISTQSIDKVNNLAPFSFFTIASSHLPILVVSINRNDGQMKDTAENIQQTKKALIHIAQESDIDDLNSSSLSLDSNHSEFDYLKLKTFKHTSGLLALKKVPVVIEVELYEHIELKDSNQEIVSDLFLLNVLNIDVDENIFNPKNHHINYHVFKPVARLGGPYYSTLNNVIKKKRPK